MAGFCWMEKIAASSPSKLRQVRPQSSPASESATAIAFDEASRRKVELVAVFAFSDIDVSDFACVERSTMQLLGEQVLVKASEAVAGAMRRLTSWSSSRSPPSSRVEAAGSMSEPSRL